MRVRNVKWPNFTWQHFAVADLFRWVFHFIEEKRDAQNPFKNIGGKVERRTDNNSLNDIYLNLRLMLRTHQWRVDIYLTMHILHEIDDIEDYCCERWEQNRPAKKIGTSKMSASIVQIASYQCQPSDFREVSIFRLKIKSDATSIGSKNEIRRWSFT